MGRCEAQDLWRDRACCDIEENLTPTFQAGRGPGRRRTGANLSDTWLLAKRARSMSVLSDAPNPPQRPYVELTAAPSSEPQVVRAIHELLRRLGKNRDGSATAPASWSAGSSSRRRRGSYSRSCVTTADEGRPGHWSSLRGCAGCSDYTASASAPHMPRHVRRRSGTGPNLMVGWFEREPRARGPRRR